MPTGQHGSARRRVSQADDAVAAQERGGVDGGLFLFFNVHDIDWSGEALVKLFLFTRISVPVSSMRTWKRLEVGRELRSIANFLLMSVHLVRP